MNPSNNISYETIELTGLPPSFFRKNRTKYLKNLREKLIGLDANSIILLQGGEEQSRYDNDSPLHFFMQESNFYYLTGIREVEFYAIIDLKDDSVTIFCHKPNASEQVFFNPETLEEIGKKYEVRAFYRDNLAEEVKKRNPNKIYVLSGINSDSDLKVHTAQFTFPEGPTPEEDLNNRYDYNGLIYEILADTRVSKTAEEIDLLFYLNIQTVKAHKVVIKSLKAGMKERDVENLFWKTMANVTYARNHPYEHICGCGEHSSILHYLPDFTELKDGQLILMDMGGKLCSYVSDVTSTIPVNGKFTEKQKAIYDIVLKANRAVQAEAKPGVKWLDMHLLAEKTIIEGLTSLNLLNKEYSTQEMVDARVAYYFMPHGLGHLMGLDVHDVGGYLSFTPPRSTLPGLSSLRCGRYLSVNTVITVEPGIYFVKFLLEQAFVDEKIKKYFNIDNLKTYYDFGGVRIEDNIVITEDGSKNLTADLPRKTEEIEELMKK